MRIDEKAIRESELAMSRARQMAARPGSSGFGFEANSPAELKQGLALMKRQLQDMEAHRRQYELALQNGFVIAGFGGNLDGIEVPETLMTGEVPAGMTPSQAFDEVVDYMRKIIENLSTKLGDKTTKAAELPKRATKYLESKNLKEDVDGFTFKELTKKTWDEYIKDALEKLKAKVEDYEDKEDVAMILENIIDDATEVADGSFETYQELAILHLFEEKFDDLESLNKALKAFGIEEIKNDEMDESVITNKKDLKESKDTCWRKFFNFDDTVDEDGGLKQMGATSDWLQDLIDCGYLDNMQGVWFEDANDDAEAAGIELKTMPDIIEEDPDAQFGFSYGGPDTRLILLNAMDYIENDACDDWEGFGIPRPFDDEDDDDDEDCYSLDDDDADVEEDDGIIRHPDGTCDIKGYDDYYSLTDDDVNAANADDPDNDYVGEVDDEPPAKRPKRYQEVKIKVGKKTIGGYILKVYDSECIGIHLYSDHAYEKNVQYVMYHGHGRWRACSWGNDYGGYPKISGRTVEILDRSARIIYV